MNIAVISHLFPTDLTPHQGKFISDQIELVKSTNLIEKELLVVPTPFSLPFSKRSKSNSSNLLVNGIKELRFRYLSFPRKKFPKIIQKSMSSRLIKSINCNEIDLFHVHFLYPNGLCIPYLNQLGHKTILTIHGGDYYRSLNIKSLKPIIEQVFDSVSRILVVGPQLYDDINSDFPTHRNKIYRQNNHVDENFYSLPSILEKSLAKNFFGWDIDKKHFLCIANNRPEKGLDILFDAINKMPDLQNRIQFHIIGNLEDSFREIDLIPNEMIDIIQPVSPSDLVKYYHASDAYIFPSRKEGFGLAMIEAACTGLPVVATPAGIAKEFVSSEIGILNNNLDPEKFGTSVRELFSKLDTFTPNKIRERVLLNYGKENFLQNLTSTYKEVIEQ